MNSCSLLNAEGITSGPSCSMQEHVLEQQPSHLQVKLSSVRDKFRQAHHRLSTKFRRSRKYDSEATTSPSIDQPDQCFSHNNSIPPQISFSSQPSISTTSRAAMDGSADRMFGWTPKTRSPTNVSAIFVHAGAGYHSTANEHIHLGACNEYVNHATQATF